MKVDQFLINYLSKLTDLEEWFVDIFLFMYIYN